MKVLVITNHSFFRPSTSAHLMKAIIQQLAESGNNVYVLQMLKPDDQLILPESLLEYDIKTDGIKVKPQRKDNFISRYYHAVKNYLSYKRLLIENSNADAVFLQSTNVAGVAVWLVRKYMKHAIITYNVQDIMPYNLAYSGKIKQDGIIFRILAAVQRYGYRNSDHIITISEDMKNTLILDGVDASKIELIYNWSYQDKVYENLDFTTVAHIFNKNYFNVVYAGNIGVMQNVNIVIQAAKIMKEDKAIWFHIIGEGAYKKKLEVEAKKYGIENITFWPMQPSETAPLIYSNADVNVIPLEKNVYRTALPSKTATCLACQQPIIFAVGKESKFFQKLMKETGCPVIGTENPDELRDTIKKIQSGKISVHTKEAFLRDFGITNNSRKYADIITRENFDA